jgi:hypothetical protein
MNRSHVYSSMFEERDSKSKQQLQLNTADLPNVKKNDDCIPNNEQSVTVKRRGRAITNNGNEKRPTPIPLYEVHIDKQYT